MERPFLTILGSGSAMPKPDHFHTSQILDIRNKQFMIDCGEGAQIRVRQYKVKTARLTHIFISHLHGDHWLGLPGLISSLGMNGRTSDFYIHANPDLEKLLKPILDYSCSDFPFKVYFEPYSPYKSAVIYEDRVIKITTIPLKHRVPTCGFLFEEKNKQRHINRAVIDAYEVPVEALKNIKNGADFITKQGEVILNNRLTTPSSPSVRYAYISDTAYYEKIIPYIEGVDCLYHESTFLDEDVSRIKFTLHSSAKQAALIAKKANVKKLLIGHYSARYNSIVPLLNEARETFPNTFATSDGSVFEL